MFGGSAPSTGSSASFGSSGASLGGGFGSPANRVSFTTGPPSAFGSRGSAPVASTRFGSGGSGSGGPSTFGGRSGGFGLSGSGSGGFGSSGSSGPAPTAVPARSGFGFSSASSSSSPFGGVTQAAASASAGVGPGGEESKQEGVVAEKPDAEQQQGERAPETPEEAAARMLKEKLDSQKSPEERARDAEAKAAAEAEAKEREKRAGADGSSAAVGDGLPFGSGAHGASSSSSSVGPSESGVSGGGSGPTAPSSGVARNLESAWAHFDSNSSEARGPSNPAQSQLQLLQQQQQQQLQQLRSGSFGGFSSSPTPHFARPQYAGAMQMQMPMPPRAAPKRGAHAGPSKRDEPSSGQELLIGTGCSIASIQQSPQFQQEMARSLAAPAFGRVASTSTLLSGLLNLQHKSVVGYSRQILRSLLAHWPQDLSLRDFAPPDLLAEIVHVALALDASANIAAGENEEEE